MTDAYSLSEARSLAEKVSENLPASDSDGQSTPMSGNSVSSRLTPEQKKILEPYDTSEDELEEGEIRVGEREKTKEPLPNSKEELTASSSRSLTLSNQDNTSLHLSVYDEDGKRKLYVYSDAPFTLPLADFRRYLAEITDDDELAELEDQRRSEFDTVASASVFLGAFLGAGLLLWFYYLLCGIRSMS